MQVLARGQKARLDTLSPSLTGNAHVKCTAPGLSIDFSCFGVDEAGQLSDDRYFVFFNQPSSPEGALKLGAGKANESHSFEIDLSRLPKTIRRLVFTATIDGAGEAKQLQGGHFALWLGGAEAARFEFSGSDFANEKAIIVAEVYWKDAWRVAAVGQGFNGGLSALLKHFGGQEVEEQAPASTSGAGAAPASTSGGGEGLLKTEKVVLAKQEKVSIAKAGRITAALEWRGEGDLDLYCFYVDSQGREGKIYYRNLGSTGQPPFIALDGDSRVPGRETITIARPDALRYALIAAYSAVENGTGSFASYQPRAVITDDRGQSVTVPLLEQNEFAYWAAIAWLDFSGAAGNLIRHAETYSAEGEEASPLLYSDGRFAMDVGPVEFKDFDDF